MPSMPSEQAENQVVRLLPTQAACLVGVCALWLGSFGLLEAVRLHLAFQWSFFGASLLLLLWAGVLFSSAQGAGRTFELKVALRKQHFVQALAQGLFFLYWGWYWSPLYDSAFLILAQLVFAYGFNMLLCWSRRDRFILGFGPFPVIFSVNLFLWFRDDWFYLQFLLVAFGFLVKELIHWSRDGQRVHIFNPSSFPLAVFSLALILTENTEITWAQDIATSQFYPPHVYLVLFLVALPGQYFFGVASMTLSAVVATYVFGLIYFGVTGVYFFYDSYIPIAVFLGMHLLFTDPSTAPKTELGRLMFGTLYGLTTVGLYSLLSQAGVPPVYDKLLQVPVLNLSVQLLDRLGRSSTLRRWQFKPGFLSWGGYKADASRPGLVCLGIWLLVFTGMTAARALGDEHPGQWVPFWQKACRDQRPGACRYLTDMQRRFCDSGSGWACNEAGILRSTWPHPITERPWIRLAEVRALLQRGCDLSFEAACVNLKRANDEVGQFQQDLPTLVDWPIVLRGTKGPLENLSPSGLYARACSQEWPEACGWENGDD